MYKRKNAKYFYAQIKNPETGQYMKAKSTGKSEESEALLVVADWMKYGIPEGRTETRREMREAVALDMEMVNYTGQHESSFPESYSITESGGIRLPLLAELPIIYTPRKERIIPGTWCNGRNAKQ